MKKVLVMDDIDMCGQCNLCKNGDNFYNKDNFYCRYSGMEIEFDKLHENCPLKDLPNELEKLEETSLSVQLYQQGWNDCLWKIQNQK